MKLKVVCFDIDGTLYPKWVTNWKLIRSFFPSPLFAVRYQQFRKYIRAERGERTVPADEQGFRQRQATWLCQKFDQRRKKNDIHAVSAKIEQQFYNNWRKSFAKIKPFPFVREAFEALHNQGIVIAALSDFPIEQKLVALGVDDLVDFAACTESSGYLKPHAEPFLMICDKLKVAPDEVLYVGDSCRKDIVGAAQVGMKTALIDPASRSKKQRVRRRKMCPQAHIIFSDYVEFLEYLPELLH